MPIHRALVLAACASILLAGCVALDEPPEEPAAPTAQEMLVTRTWEETFTGTVLVGNPLQMDETAECAEGVPGEEGVTYDVVAFEVTNAPSMAMLTLDWDGNSVGGLWTFPDLELRLLGPDGTYLDNCEGVSAEETERLALMLLAPGTHQAVVIGYAGVMVDYSLHVSLTWQELVEAVEA